MKSPAKTVLIWTLFIIGSTLYGAGAQEFTVGFTAGSLGFGGEVGIPFSDYVSVRLGGNYYTHTISDYEYESDETSLTVDGKVNLRSVGIFADYYPFRQLVRISGGLVYHGNGMSADIRPMNIYQLGGDQYTPERLGKLSGDVGFQQLSPYLGLGIGHFPRTGTGWLISANFGGIYHGQPQVGLSGEGLIEPTASRDQEKVIEESISGFTWWPVISFNLGYRFSL